MRLWEYINSKYYDEEDLNYPYYPWFKKESMAVQHMFLEIYERVSLYLTNWNYKNYITIRDLIETDDKYSHDYCICVAMRILGFEHWNLYYFYNMTPSKLYELMDKKMEYGIKKIKMAKKLNTLAKDFE